MDRQRLFARDLRNHGTAAERLLWRHLRRRQLAGCKFRRQHPIADFIVDFVCLDAGLIVELDGGQHVEARCRDEQRTARLEASGFAVIRFWNDDVFLRTEDVLNAIVRRLRELASAAE